MNEIIISIIGGVCVAIPSVIATITTNKKSTALMAYRIEKLENKVEKHNSMVERTYKLEGQVEELQKDMKEFRR